MEKKRTKTVNSILDQPEELVERLLAQCEYYGNKIVDRIIAQIKKNDQRRALALRLVFSTLPETMGALTFSVSLE